MTSTITSACRHAVNSSSYEGFWINTVAAAEGHTIQVKVPVSQVTGI